MPVDTTFPILDSGFETPPAGPDGYTTPTSGPWVFTTSQGSDAGVSVDNSAITSGVSGANPGSGAHEGSQVAFIQDVGVITQSVANWAANTYYQISFLAAQRVYSTDASVQAQHVENFEVVIDYVKQANGSFTGQIVYSGSAAATSYQRLFTSAFAISDPSAPHSITFLGISSTGDSTVLIDAVRVQPVPQIMDAGFETPVDSGGYLVEPLYSTNQSGTQVNLSWTFTGDATNNRAGITATGPNAITSTQAPDGQQAGFIQGTGSISQSVSNWAAGIYQLSFMAAAPQANEAAPESFEVLVDGVVAATFMPISSTYATFTVPFAVTAGTHSITFQGLANAANSIALIDKVQIRANPLPAIADPDFNYVNVAPNAVYSTPGQLGASPWTFSYVPYNGTGISGDNVSGLTSNQPSGPASDSTPVAFIQDNGTIYQSVSGWLAGTYRISFLAALPSGQQSGLEDFKVIIDPGTASQIDLGTIVPPASSTTSFFEYITIPFTVAAGAHTVEFQGVHSGSGEYFVLIDQVQITPE